MENWAAHEGQCWALKDRRGVRQQGVWSAPYHSLREESSSEKTGNLGKNALHAPLAQSSWLLWVTCYNITGIFRALLRADEGGVMPPGKDEAKWTHSKIQTDHRDGS